MDGSCYSRIDNLQLRHELPIADQQQRADRKDRHHHHETDQLRRSRAPRSHTAAAAADKAAFRNCAEMSPRAPGACVRKTVLDLPDAPMSFKVSKYCVISTSSMTSFEVESGTPSL